MKQSIQLRLGQHLTMTPQLQQAIRLLQLSTVELRMEVQQALESNLMLEPVEDDIGDDEAPMGDDDAGSMDNYDRDDGENQRELDTATSSDDGIPEELPVDGAWDDIYDGGVPYTPAAGGDSNGQDFFENQGTTTESLRDHLLWQMGLTPFSETDMMIAMTIIDSVGEDGYLALPLEEVHRSLPAELDVDLEEVEAVLHRIQRFDPVGVAARSASECLLIQLQQFDEEIPWRRQAETLVEHHLDLLANRDYAQLMKRMKLSESQLQEVIRLIQSLDPHPGSRITTETPEYIIPDVFVSKHKGTWRVELNPDAAPKLRINPYYASLARQSGNKEDNNYLKNHLQEARWFLKSLQSRNETLLKVATCIVEHQRGFLEKGDEAMQPLVLRDVAEAINMHESTISRVTTQKYMYTPRGIYEFKYFFSSHVGTADGGECSATAIRAMIKKLVSNETPGRPLSDSAIANMLEKQGINVARRTVTKYREAMSIPPSNKRKRLAW